jgi:hypothetical protein
MHSRSHWLQWPPLQSHRPGSAPRGHSGLRALREVLYRRRYCAPCAYLPAVNFGTPR